MKTIAIIGVLMWASNGKFIKQGDEAGRVHLPGLEDFNHKRQKTYVLSDNPQGASHLFTKKRAAEIAEKYFTDEPHEEKP